MRPLSNLHVKDKPAVLPDRAMRGQSHYFIYRPRMYPARKTMVTQTVFTDCFQNEFPEQKDTTFHRPVCCSSTAEPKECEHCFLPPRIHQHLSFLLSGNNQSFKH